MKFSFISPGPNETLLKGQKTMINASPPLGILYIVSMRLRHFCAADFKSDSTQDS